MQEMLQDVLTSAVEAAGSLVGHEQLLEASESSEKALELVRAWDSLVAKVNEALWKSKVQRMGIVSVISC